MTMHAGQLRVDAGLARRLIASQFPRWSGLAVTAVRSSGTVNAILRVGSTMAARFPLVARDLDDARAWLQQEAAAASELAEAATDAMCHQDLKPPNALVEDGRLTGLLDGGGFGPADRALDLVSAWHLLDDERRALFRDAVGSGDVQWRPGMAWAFQQAMGLVWYHAESNPVMSRWGRRSLGRIVRAA